MKIRTKVPNFAWTKELNENTNKSTKFWLKVWQEWALAREYDVDIEKYVSNLVMLIINKYRRLVQFWQNFQTSLVLLIPNCTRHRMIIPILIGIGFSTSFFGMLFQYAPPLYEKQFFKKFVFGLGRDSFKLLLRSIRNHCFHKCEIVVLCILEACH
jgi:hypothetical protein